MQHRGAGRDSQFAPVSGKRPARGLDRLIHQGFVSFRNLRDYRAVGRIDIRALAWTTNELPVHIVLEKLRARRHAVSEMHAGKVELTQNIILIYVKLGRLRALRRRSGWQNSKR